MSNARSLITVAVMNPDLPDVEYSTEAIVSRVDEATGQNTLKVTVTNISRSGLCLTKGRRFKLGFANLPLTASAVQDIQLSQPAQDWSASAIGVVLELTYAGADFTWEDGMPLAFTLDGIVDFDLDKAGTLSVEVDQVPAPSKGNGKFMKAALLVQAPQVDLPPPVQVGMETQVLYTTQDFSNTLKFYLENAGDVITQASVEVSLAYGSGESDSDQAA